mgnify:CR=1 FL=1
MKNLNYEEFSVLDTDLLIQVYEHNISKLPDIYHQNIADYVKKAIMYKLEITDEASFQLWYKLQ